jgi:hypothetical protein
MPQFKLANLQRAVIHVPESAAAPIASNKTNGKPGTGNLEFETGEPMCPATLTGFSFPVFHSRLYIVFQP